MDRVKEVIHDDINGGWNGVGHGDLGEIRETLEGLNDAEFDAVMADLSDEELRKWIKEMGQEPTWLPAGGWDQKTRQEMWSKILKGASRETIDRMSKFTDDIQPRFDDVDGDFANPGRQKIDGEYRDVSLPIFEDGPSMEDVNQGALGDCWYLASLMAVARANPSLIEEAITDNKNGSYTVRLYSDGKPVYITVTDDEVYNKNGGRAFVRSGERWPAIMEKALASYKGTYGAIEGG